MDSSQSQSGFRSRRSYPTLHHVSLSPLNPRFPIDDDTDAPDYFSPSHEITGTPSTTRTSYLSSFSVPGTPGVLSHSHSRSGSRVRRHSRSKSSTRIHSSDTNLQSRSVASPLHHQQNEEPRRSRTRSSRRHPDAVHHHHNPDTEWMLRAGIALASSTREEKGQSWLVKRQSSTSLVSDSHQIDLDSQQHQQPWTSRSSTRRSQSGISTPAAYSRRASRSRPTSRRSSRPDLAMTSLDITRFTSTSDSLHASEDELDEQEFQRLTRERGFGLGSWIDRMVEWTLFGVDDWPLSTTTTTAPPAVTSVETTDHDPQSLMHENIRSQETDTISIATESDIASISEEKPGTRGGWEDAGWLFRVVKRALS
ncbi:Ubiquitin elongating factor core family protein [Aspergillus niger]|uniref:Ubiquitin elongating factor core family protein n=1 Tax=Aspergillus niger TaxID=5061 RepID=A0A505HV54_ASPNG|nr:Ubiquitin elongating factor core family protein [Aspergillus niger]